MNAKNLKYPLLWFSQDLVDVAQAEEGIIVCTRAALHSDFFDNLLLVDANGYAIRIIGAKKLHGVGFLWGYNIFLNQKIRVELIPDGEPFKLSLDEVRAKVLKVLRGNRSFWESGGNFEEIEQAIVDAKAIPEIISSIPA